MNQVNRPSAQPRVPDQVHQALLALISEGKLRPGERIIQEQIAERLGVSRQPVQHALLLLRDQGVLCDAPGRGLMVAPLDLHQVRHLYDVRAVIEGLAFGKAASINSERARKLCPMLIANGRDAVRSGSVAQMIEADAQLHSFVYDLSANPLVGQLLNAQWAYIQRVMGEVLMRDDTQRGIWDQHERMIDAVMAGDSREAECLAREHIMASASFIIACLRDEHEPAATGGRSPKVNGQARPALAVGEHPRAALPLHRALLQRGPE